MNSKLDELKKYKNHKVITYFCHHHPEFSLDDGQCLLEDLLSWMWLNNKRSELGKKTYLFGPLLILDEMWHTFILHTRDYIDFSMHYFGEYVHHDVEPIGFEHVLEEDELTDFLQDCFDYLDQDWVARRFSSALTDET
ncbi:hypothetical protein [Legionella bononiensis]|uniref:Uncharacterized protein n=1 Tax=Legionella bononiensis TaxID=2793102 RepID=A0ABS1WA37_9GAMM|nr:hypothetical protein [Legionella bononiensis]MBL7480538.1 hypothetical protein [Legionella bononiensis]MBL7526223.1 hypothetical protein [Legionella bononiensis]MBL7563282.1 hypothetical protein [Legionella bononiensis]